MKKLISVILTLSLVIELRFFYIIKNLPIVGEDFSKITIILLLITLVLFCGTIFLKPKYIFGGSVLIFIFIYCLQLLICSFRYNQSIYDIFLVSKYNLIILLYFIMVYFSRNIIKIENFDFYIIGFSFILSFLIDAQYIVFDKGMIFLNVNFNNLRFGTLRLYESADFINLGCILATSYLFKKNIKKSKKIICFITIILCFFNNIFVAKVRMGLVITLICVLIISFLELNKSFFKVITFFIATLFIFITFINTNIAKDYLMSLETEKVSKEVRESTSSYYIEQFKDYPLMGIGYMKSYYDGDQYYQILRGTDERKAYREDVGIIGFLNTFGIIGILWYFYICVKIIVVCVNTRRKNIDDFAKVLSICIFIIISSSSLIIMDKQRILLLPIILTIIDNVNYTINNKKDKFSIN
ncbi:hypothetical protein ACSXC0_14435 [Clostridium perfringens]|uniref:hypothetical protein n=1 Tax=Clostridium perfringens TaxID=1502 RepID=UPI003682950B